ncbi:phosphodiester glycosidase family protein [Candidatus Enterococcus clewellii]|uniref:Phosphodiester glycosidase domain-containing protein n=1 Tax=Candidatus Enterococcus clewellii TaxID=1834193 RepID=A0A242KDF3_9ENTE|nr:phosphodiester glycosidase family protein [Enterococcus sp. 9E7_DIV0242]OTP19182.1 hypothetical protein A5888_000996 [Enterococcus sp. 9E7_DIV0242]
MSSSNEKPFKNIDVQMFEAENGTKYFLVETDERLQRGFAYDKPGMNSGETARGFAGRNATSLVTNASTAQITSTGLLQPRGINIHEGEVVFDKLPNNLNRWYLGIDGNGNLSAHEPQKTAKELLDFGLTESLIGFCPLVLDGKLVDKKILDDYAIVTAPEVINPLQLIYQYENGRIGFFTCNGRMKEQPGMNAVSVAEMLIKERKIQFLYMLDGGGSAQTVVRNRLINRPVDGHGTQERQVADFLYVPSSVDTPCDAQIANLGHDLGLVTKDLTDLSAKVENGVTIDYTVDFNLNTKTLASGNMRYLGLGFQLDDKLFARMFALKNTDNGITFAFQDYANNKRILTIRDNRISLSEGTLAKNYTQSIVIHDLDEISGNGEYWANMETLNSPKNGNHWAITHRELNTRSAIQVAYSLRAEDGVKKRVKILGEWSEWFAV